MPARKTKPKIILVASGKGGVGKTTTAVHLASLITDSIIVDLDPKRGTRFYKNLTAPVLGQNDPIPDGTQAIILDCPPSADLVAVAANHYGPLLSHIVIPMNPTREDIELAKELMQATSHHTQVQYGVVLTFLTNDQSSKIIPEVIEQDLGWNLVGRVRFRSAVYRNVRISGPTVESAEPYLPVVDWLVQSAQQVPQA